MRVYEYAKSQGLAAKEVLKIVRDAGFELESHMSVLSEDALAYLKKQFAPAAPEPSASIAAKPVALQKPPLSAESITKRDEGIVIAPMTVSDFALKAKKPVTEVILSLLKQGIVAAKNQVIAENIVAQLVKLYGLKQAEAVARGGKVAVRDAFDVQGERVEERLPIVVVIGHVDHGKTTLLDYIRKTRVAAREKGGITQHLGAYEAETPHGNLVFLDTPGHEAFTKMRERGTRVADIAVLVVAADDGVMPQTIEAIKQAQAAKLPIVVAINKIDKANAQQVEVVKRQLTQYGVVPEEWGGDAICLPVSAKLGTGIDQLLEVLVLQSKMMDLVATLDTPARGYVLESKMEKGLGPVATVILHHGIVHVGDHFVAGTKFGKVVSLVNSWGKRVQAVHPSHPVQIAGLESLVSAGDLFEVIPASEFKKRRVSAQGLAGYQARSLMQQAGIGLVIKVDNDSTREALLDALEKINKKAYQPLHVVHIGIGSVSESDMQLAVDTTSLVYTLHAKIEPSALALANKNGVVCRQFDIIYKLLENLQEVAEHGRPVKMIAKKVGEALVLKVFNIKNIGIIAGLKVTSGKLIKGAKAVVWRGKHKVGEGEIVSLQRDKKSVKEVLVGFECALSVDSFEQWVVDDRLECFQEVPAEQQ